MTLPLITAAMCSLNLILTAAVVILWRMWRTERGLRRYIQSLERLRYSTAVVAARQLSDDTTRVIAAAIR